MKIAIKILLSAAVGFILATLFLNHVRLDLTDYANEIAIGLLILILILFIIAFGMYRQIKSLSREELHGDEEDEADVSMYKKFSDASFLIQCTITLSLLVLCISVISFPNTAIIILSMVAMVFGYVFIGIIHQLLPSIYPERKLPKFGEANYEEKVLSASDEGERHVMLIGLYKSYGLVNGGLFISIILSTFYSFSSGDSQLFSIIIMGIVLILVNGKYSLSVRNK